MQTVELIDQTAKVLRLLQREFEDYIASIEAASIEADADERVLKCRAASAAISRLVPALREVRSTQESQNLLDPSPPCPDYDAF